VDLRVLKDRSLAVGTFFTSSWASLYARCSLPRLRQNLLGFTAMQTGLILLPGSLATAVMMPVVAGLLQREYRAAHERTRLHSFFFFTWMLSHSTLSSNVWTSLALILRGVGLGFLFVPLTTWRCRTCGARTLPRARA